MTWEYRNHLLLLVSLTLIHPSEENFNDYFEYKNWFSQESPPEPVALIRTNNSMDIVECSLERLCLKQRNECPSLGRMCKNNVPIVCYIHRDCFNKTAVASDRRVSRHQFVSQISEKCKGENYTSVQMLHFMCWVAEASPLPITPGYCDDYDHLCKTYSEIPFPPKTGQTTLPPTANAKTTPPESTTVTTTVLPLTTTTPPESTTTATLPLTTTTTTPPESTTITTTAALPLTITTLPESTTIATTSIVTLPLTTTTPPESTIATTSIVTLPLTTTTPAESTTIATTTATLPLTALPESTTIATTSIVKLPLTTITPPESTITTTTATLQTATTKTAAKARPKTTDNNSGHLSEQKSSKETVTINTMLALSLIMNVVGPGLVYLYMRRRTRPMMQQNGVDRASPQADIELQSNANWPNADGNEEVVLMQEQNNASRA